LKLLLTKFLNLKVELTMEMLQLFLVNQTEKLQNLLNLKLLTEMPLYNQNFLHLVLKTLKSKKS